MNVCTTIHTFRSSTGEQCLYRVGFLSFESPKYNRWAAVVIAEVDDVIVGTIASYGELLVPTMVWPSRVMGASTRWGARRRARKAIKTYVAKQGARPVGARVDPAQCFEVGS